LNGAKPEEIDRISEHAAAFVKSHTS